MTRWWWFGGAVTPEEITRELTFMKQAGLRGAEIQPVYPIAMDDPARGIRNLNYFSEEFLAVLRHAVREARRLALQLDFTLGSGWPYGGPFIPTNLAARRLRVLSQDVVGPRDYSWDLTPHLAGDDRVVRVVATPVREDAVLDVARSRVLADQPKPEVAQGVRRGSFLRTRVEEGTWRLMLFLDSPTGQLVKRPTIGMEGPVLDHHSREAMALFLRAAGDRVMNALAAEGAPPFHSVFCDSLEVYGADWTKDFLTEFEKRRGYDLAPYLPALFHDVGDVTPHVHHDAHLTLSELNLDYFFAPLVAWAEARGMKARIQAHGAPGDVMQAYGRAHIPEGENIFLGDRYQVNLRHRRLASSAAHLYGKPLASSETYTWLRTPLFVTTLEQMKPATDAVLLDGLNHIVNHGYSYSPPQAGEPGWSFYASTEANHTNTWWRHYPHLARYVQRTCALLQTGVAVNPVAVYLPVPDLFAQFGAGGLHIDVEAEGLLDAGLLMGLRQAGYDFDMIHDHALAELARVEAGELRAGTARYKVVIVPNARYMPPESAARLAELVRAGGHVIFVERLPEGAAGLRDREARSAQVRRELAGLSLVADRAAALARLGAVLQPDFEIVGPSVEQAEARKAAIENVGFVHRRLGACDYYFVANVSAHTQDLRVRFAASHRSPERLDPETGEVAAPLAYDYVTRGRPDVDGGRAAPRPVRIVLRRVRDVARAPAPERAPPRRERRPAAPRPGRPLDARARPARSAHPRRAADLDRAARRARLQRLGHLRDRLRGARPAARRRMDDRPRHRPRDRRGHAERSLAGRGLEGPAARRVRSRSARRPQSPEGRGREPLDPRRGEPSRAGLDRPRGDLWRPLGTLRRGQARGDSARRPARAGAAAAASKSHAAALVATSPAGVTRRASSPARESGRRAGA